MTTKALALNGTQLDLCRRTVARDCNQTEFEYFIETCKQIGLNPLLKQIYCAIYGKDGTDSRKMVIMTGIDGYRAISARSGTYRPASEAPLFEHDEGMKGHGNPSGLKRAQVTLFQYSHGEWFPVVGEALWIEYAPLVCHPADMVPTGETWPDGNPKKAPKPDARMTVDPKRKPWVERPTSQLAKCAEANAHRRGWPNDFCGVLISEEADRMATLDLTANQIADVAVMERRQTLMGIRGAVMLDFTGEIEAIQPGAVHDRVDAYLRACVGEPDKAKSFWQRNRQSLNHFHTLDRNASLAIKGMLERAAAQPKAVSGPVVVQADPKQVADQTQAGQSPDKPSGLILPKHTVKACSEGPKPLRLREGV